MLTCAFGSGDTNCTIGAVLAVRVALDGDRVRVGKGSVGNAETVVGNATVEGTSPGVSVARGDAAPVAETEAGGAVGAIGVQALASVNKQTSKTMGKSRVDERIRIMVFNSQAVEHYSANRTSVNFSIDVWGQRGYNGRD